MGGVGEAGSRRGGKRRRTSKAETVPKLHSSVLRSHRTKLERTCALKPEDQSSYAVEVGSAEELEEIFASTGLDRIAVHRLGSRSKEDVFRTLHMSYPTETLEEFKTQLARFVDEELVIPTINVKTQSDGRPLTMQGVIEYFSKPPSKRGDILNITSFNLGQTGLDGLVVAPRIVRDLDLVNRAWPSQRMVRFFDDLVHNPFAFFQKIKIGEGATSFDVYSPPKTMTYLLLGPEGAYTDWHVDFAGSSVWYHVVKGKKVFMAAPDTAHNIQQFLSWSSSDEQDEFLGDRLEKCVRLELSEGDTMFLPGGWLHAVSTPKDSVVVGGNYINPLRLKQLLTVRKIERRLGISPQAEFPKFDMLMYYAAGDFIKRCQQSREVEDGVAKTASGVFVSELEAKGLESLGRYLQSVVEELESSAQTPTGRVSKEMRVLREQVDLCKEEVGLMTSFLKIEVERLKAVYDLDDSAQGGLSFLDVAPSATNASGSERALQCMSDEDSYRPDEDEMDEMDEMDEEVRLDGGDDKENSSDAQISSERAEESVEVILGVDDVDTVPSSLAGCSEDVQGSMEVFLSSSDGEDSEEPRTMAGTRSRHRLITESDGGVYSDESIDNRVNDGDVAGEDSTDGAEGAIQPVNESGSGATEDEYKSSGVDNNADGVDEPGHTTESCAADKVSQRRKPLEDLIDAGVISPGKEVLLWKYKNFKEMADLTEDGAIEITVDGERKAFNAPTSFALFMSRRYGSSRKTCNGWLEVIYEGLKLCEWRDGGNGALHDKGMPPLLSKNATSDGARATTGTLSTATLGTTPKNANIIGERSAPRTDTGFLLRYKEKGDDQLPSKTDRLRAEALKKHPDLIAIPLGSRRAGGKCSDHSNKVASEKASPEVSAKAAEVLTGVHELTKICNQLLKEQDLLDQVNSGKLSLKDGGEILRERVQKKVEAFNSKAATLSTFLSSRTAASSVSEEVVKVQPDIIGTIGRLIKLANREVSKSLDSPESRNIRSQQANIGPTQRQGKVVEHDREQARVHDHQRPKGELAPRNPKDSTKQMKKNPPKTHDGHQNASQDVSKRPRPMEKMRPSDRDRGRDRDRDRDRDRGRDRDRDRDRDRKRGRERHHDRDRKRDRERHHDRDRKRDRDHDGKQRLGGDRDRKYDQNRDRDLYDHTRWDHDHARGQNWHHRDHEGHQDSRDEDRHRHHHRKMDTKQEITRAGDIRPENGVRGSPVPMQSALPDRNANVDTPAPHTMRMVADPRIAAMRSAGTR